MIVLALQRLAAAAEALRYAVALQIVDPDDSTYLLDALECRDHARAQCFAAGTYLEAARVAR